ncbi:MAG: glycine/betaine ABC transporter substrate-binding protein [Streptosporangiales bacterium]|nr:glycine/betaine ABC transporter substrate-binding protein [Streptosporangiales bacterium]
MRRSKVARLTAGAAGLLALSLFTAACGGGSDEAGNFPKAPNGDKKEITIGWVSGWDEDLVATHLWKKVLESKGYTVKLQNLEAAPLYQGMAKGDIDLYLDTWLPVTHADYWKQHQDDLEDIGVWYDKAKLTIAVPNYMKDVNSIADLKGKGGELNGEIVGIEPGAGLTRVTEDEAIPKYGLKDEYKLTKSSTPAMLTELKRATEKKKPIVVTLWRPHWAYSKFPVKDLQDPQGAMGATEKVHTTAREGFSKDFPKLAGWLKKFKMNDEDLGTLEDTVINKYGKGKEAQGTEEWMKENPDFVKQMTS